MSENLTALKLICYSITDVGSVRNHNEDAFLVINKDLDLVDFNLSESFEIDHKGFFVVVTDGMGGAEAGEVASELAIISLKEQFNNLINWPNHEKAVRESLINFGLSAHFKIVNHALDNPKTEGMGTTLAMAVFIHNKVHIAWCGDSRIYRFNQNLPPNQRFFESQQLRICSHDHSIVWEEVKKRRMTAEEARVHPQSNIILQSLGNPDSLPEIEVATFDLLEGDKWLVCSDGLNGMIPDAEIERILRQEDSLEVISNQLINSAKAAGGYDNITSIIVKIDSIPDGALTTFKVDDKEKIRINRTTRQDMITSSNPLEVELNQELEKQESEKVEKVEKIKFNFKYILIGIAVFGLIFLIAYKKLNQKITEPKSATMDIGLLNKKCDKLLSKYNDTSVPYVDSLLLIRNEINLFETKSDSEKVQLFALLQSKLEIYESELSTINTQKQNSNSDAVKNSVNKNDNLINQFAEIKNQKEKLKNSIENAKNTLKANQYKLITDKLTKWSTQYPTKQGEFTPEKYKILHDDLIEFQQLFLTLHSESKLPSKTNNNQENKKVNELSKDTVKNE